jgi:triacylglycerol esterase/lipase EstA (alpha/beta hydrolase family)
VRLLAILAVTVALGAAAPAGAQTFADPQAPGPELSVPAAELDAALTCSDGVTGATRAPVLLLQGTGATAKDNWSWTYEPALSKLGIPWCQVDVPDHATQDIQRNAEFVVHAIRAVHARAGRRVSIIGHSQGGMVGRWALRFWPDLRPMVDDVIGFAPSNHGTTQAAQTCGDGSCSPSNWQQWNVSNFMKALNSAAETWQGISYTNVVTRLDEIVTPPTSGFLTTGAGRITNVVSQDVCPSSVAEHLLLGLTDPVAYALAVDALEHDGPADPRRVPVTTCAMAVHPGIDPVTAPASAAAALRSFSGYQAAETTSEPPLRCYVTASCPRTGGGAGSCVARRLTVRVPRGLREVRVTLDGRRLRVVRRGGRREVRVDLRGRRAGRAVLRITGRRASGRRVVQVRRVRVC